MPCMLSGTVMLGIPTLLALAAPGRPDSESATALGLVVAMVLAVGATSVLVTLIRPGQGGSAPLAVLCAALALVFAPLDAWADGLTGVAALLFLLSARMHAAASRRVVDAGQWWLARRPMLVGAAVTTPAAVASALVPAAWSLPVAGVVGIAAAGLCALLLSD